MPGGDHRVQRQQQVRRRVADRDRDAERQRRDRRQREHGRPAVHDPREHDDADRGGHARGRHDRPDVGTSTVVVIDASASTAERGRGEHRERPPPRSVVTSATATATVVASTATPWIGVGDGEREQGGRLSHAGGPDRRSRAPMTAGRAESRAETPSVGDGRSAAIVARPMAIATPSRPASATLRPLGVPTARPAPRSAAGLAAAGTIVGVAVLLSLVFCAHVRQLRRPVGAGVGARRVARLPARVHGRLRADAASAGDRGELARAAVRRPGGHRDPVADGAVVRRARLPHLPARRRVVQPLGRHRWRRWWCSRGRCSCATR